MKWELDDNTSDGIRFLLVGAGSLLVLRLLYNGVLHFAGPAADDALALACTPFHHGYWITDPHTVVLHAGGGIGTRLAMALAVSMLTAVVLAALAYVLTGTLWRKGGTWAIRTLRLTLILSLCWWLFAALARPAGYARFNAAGMELVDEAALLGQLSLPWPAARVRMNWTDVRDFTVQPVENGMAVNALTPQGAITLAGGDANDAMELAGQLRAWRSKHVRP